MIWKKSSEGIFWLESLSTDAIGRLNRYVGVEGEVSGGLGVKQDLRFSGETLSVKPPNLLNYSGNLALSFANRSSVVPYVTGGVGGLTVFDRPALGSTRPRHF